jgi:alginate O-acetyltransferase complex protein AlgJ
MYHPKDTHWNDLGGLIAYQQIINSLSVSYPNLKQLSRSDFKVVTSNKSSDLTNMMGLNGVIEDRRLSLSAKTEKLAFKVDPQVFYKPDLPSNQRPLATELRTSIAPRVVMFHDSFTENIRPFLSESFRRIVYLWQDGMDRQIVRKEHPDIVIQEIVERKLMNTPLD